MARIPLLPTTHGEIRTSLNTMLTSDIYRASTLLWFDSGASPGGNGSIASPFNAWSEVLALTALLPATRYSIIYNPQSAAGFNLAPNISVTGFGAQANNIISNTVNYNGVLKGAIESLVFAGGLFVNDQDNGAMAANTCTFQAGINILGASGADGGLRMADCIVSGSSASSLTIPLIDIVDTLITHAGAASFQIDWSNSAVTDYQQTIMTGCTINSEVKIIAGTGPLQVTMVNCLIFGAGVKVVFDTSLAGDVEFVCDVMTHTQLVIQGTSFAGVTLKVLRDPP
jgi:hypothetical protein